MTTQMARIANDFVKEKERIGLAYEAKPTDEEIERLSRFLDASVHRVFHFETHRKKQEAA